ncbi:hypothetical protein N7510_000955 [Penicillium lagena]|uniref:uncharacterized protein n=1 Tax=Penicillium lagena TaxID=94218 RepID=UPI00253F92A3|nr:uncharacterized protein N7510_000955 [Penicillium lagena]KAJ5624646.1 hypothetical protein N7510_000955 [Penicillium lagena]
MVYLNPEDMTFPYTDQRHLIIAQMPYQPRVFGRFEYMPIGSTILRTRVCELMPIKLTQVAFQAASPTSNSGLYPQLWAPGYSSDLQPKSTPHT